ncbi:glycosyltransferase [Pseudactinotalea sp. HY158]|uniref:glycosyltransferase n=1 Tax=Pseudactinotalea sp. HY158 TaxID=2654547 RepID=UPI001E2AA18D|nr:glycosyltransferase [Pseudactinotalea sp. HY158]
MTEKFSVLLPVYAGDRPDWLRRAFASITAEQTLAPDEVVLVRDGPVGAALETAIDELRAGSSVPVTYVPLPQNLRLAGALQEGLARCSHELVARADADDICLPERFARQIPAMAGLDLLGSAVAQFDDEEHLRAWLDGAPDGPGAGRVTVRTRPATTARIRDYAAFHNPFNHPSVVFRRSAVLAAGGYEDLPFMEDYWLFVRMIMAGSAVGNLPEALVGYRAGAELFDRRGGWVAMRSDWRFQRRAHSLGLTTRTQFVRNLGTRAAYRLVPGRLRAWGYQRFVATRRATQ